MIDEDVLADVLSEKSMFAVLHSLGMFIVDLFKSRRLLEAEKLFFRINSASP